MGTTQIVPPTGVGLNGWPRVRAAGIHLGLSAAVAALAGLLVFGVWYPYPYREVSGGRELFTLVVTVDVLLGPLITLSIFDTRKRWVVLRRDLAVVALLQLAALGYGLWTVYVARPVHLVFELDRFRIVHAIDVPEELLAKADPTLRAAPLLGPTLVSVRPFKDGNEKLDVTLAALNGVHIGTRPDLWQDYAKARSQVLAEAKPVAQLRARFAAQKDLVDEAVRATRRPESTLLTLPMIARKQFWTVLIDAGTADVVGFIPLDSF